jgi:hypothetical protein
MGRYAQSSINDMNDGAMPISRVEQRRRDKMQRSIFERFIALGERPPARRLNTRWAAEPMRRSRA